ncbi:MAG: sulfotransferase family protein [Pseudomonadota bacterium]
MTESGSVMYRVVPKCACSTIGQVLYYSDHGRFYDGDIHDATRGLHKMGQDHSRPLIEAALAAGRTYTFTCVRNPYRRILSSFFDKIAGIQRNGRRYRGDMVPMIGRKYGLEVGSPEDGFDFDQIANFRRFLLFARDTVRFGRPMAADIHWAPMWGHVGGHVSRGGRYDAILRVEAFEVGMRAVLDRVETPVAVDLARVPRFNESAGHGPTRAHPVAEYFDDLSRHLMWDMYHRDFRLFGYDAEDPGNEVPLREIDLDAVHAFLED